MSHDTPGPGGDASSIFEYAFRASPIPMAITRLSDGLMLDMNAAFADWSGYTDTELVDKKIATDTFWLDKKDREPFVHALLTHGTTADMPAVLQTKTLSDRKCSLSSHLLEYRSERAVITILRDLTEQWEEQERRLLLARHQKIQSDLETGLFRYRQSQQVMSFGLNYLREQLGADRAWLIFPCDPSSAALDIKMESALPSFATNQEELRRFPLTDRMRDLLDKTIRQSRAAMCFGPNEDFTLSDSVIERYGVQRQMITALQPIASETWLLCLHRCTKDQPWSEEEKNLFLSLAERLTNHLNTVLLLEELQHSESRYRDLFDSAPEAITVLDKRTGQFIEYNESMKQMLKYSGEELGRIKVWEASAPVQEGEEATKRIRELIAQVLQGRQIVHFEWIYIDSDGNEIPAEVRLSKMPDSEYLVRATAINVSEQRLLERQLHQAQKMESVGQLAGGIAHDFNNLLQGILGFSELLSRDSQLGERQQRQIKHIRSAAERAATLTSQLLAFGRRQVLKKQDININDLLRSDRREVMERILGTHIEIEVITARELGTVHADPGQIDQVLLNLIINARDAMPNGGKIIVETENVLITNEYCRAHSWATPGRFALISVSDNGIGMDADTLANIFEPFFTTKEESGSGLGLAMAYGIINQHNGMIQAYSEPGQGTTFKIYLPIVERIATEIGHKIPTTVSGGRETVLLAEDDPTVRELARNILAEAGYEVLEATDGVRAVELFRNQGQRINLVLLDVIMPKMGGKEAYEKIRQIRPDVLCLFSSGYSINAIHTDFVLKRGLELIQKPYTPTDLLRKIREILDGGPQ